MSFWKNAQTFIICGGLATYSFCALAEVDTSLDLDAAYVLDGPTTFYAGDGETKVWTGEITGTGPAVIKGGGTVAFSNSANTYSGGTLVSNAVFRLDAVGCAGTGAITGAVNTAHVYFNCASVANDMVFYGAYSDTGSVKTDRPSSTYPTAGQRPIYPLVQTVTVSGNITFRAGKSTVNTITLGNATDGKNRNITFEGNVGVTHSQSYLHIAAHGTTIFKGKFTGASSSAYRTYLAPNSSASGTTEFHSSSNVAAFLSFYHPHLSLKARDAFPKTVLFVENGGGSSSSSTGSGYSSGKIFLNGFDQTFYGLAWNSSNNPKVDDSTPGHCLSSLEKEATVRIIGTSSLPTSSASWKNYFALLGKVTFVLDVAAAHRSTFYTEFSKRLSTTTGSLLISNGNFRVSSTAAFPNVPRIYVGENATFTNLSTRTGTFAGCTKMDIEGKMYVAGAEGVNPFGYRTMDLSLGANAELALPDDYTLTVLSLNVDGEDMPDGTYEAGGAVAQITSGTVVVQGNHTAVEATWTGEGADTSVGTADNWSGSVTPDFAAGNLVAMFASGGSTATVDRAMALLGLKLAGSQSFTIAGSSPISLDSEGFTVTPAASPATERYFSIEPTVTQLSSINQVVDVPESNTVDFVNGYVQNITGDNVKKGAGTLRLGGESIAPGSWEVAEGTFALSGTNRIDKQVTITNGVFSVSGKLYQVGGNPSEYVSSYNYTQGVLDGLVNCSLLDGIPRSRVEFNNVEFAKRFSFRGPGEDAGRNWFTIAAGSTNLFTGEIMILGDCGYMTFGGGSDTTFRGPLVTGAKTIFCRSGSDPATVTITNAYFVTAGGGLNLYDGIVLKIAESLKTQPTHLLMYSTSQLYFLVDDCYKAIDSTSTVCDLRIKGASSIVDLGATRQTIPRLNCSAFNGSESEGSSSALITGLPGSELRVQSGYLLQNVTGGVSVTSYGISSSHWLTTSARAYSSTGDIKAERGIFRFVAGSSWPNGTNVTICAGAKLEINASRTFGDHAVLHAEGEGWTLSAAAGVRQKFAQFYIDGVRQPDGVYGATGNGAVMYRMDNITGEGVIVVGTPGSILILR